jgi:hypothetical protein
MSDVISEYQKWKQQGQELRTQARQAMEARFRELLAQAAQIAEEYRADFGTPLKPQPPVTAFRYKSGGRTKSRKAAKPPKPEPAPEAAPAKPNPKVAALQKRLATAKKKLEDAKAAGKPTRALEDRTYEIEDELRLSTQP